MLPIIKTEDQATNLMQTKWKSQIDPVLINPILSGVMLTNLILKTGVNVINHTLGRKQLGWWLVDKQAAADIYRSADFNDKTLTLTSDANVAISLMVY